MPSPIRATSQGSTNRRRWGTRRVSEHRLLRILHVEDDPLDRALVADTLRDSGLRCAISTVDRESDFVEALTTGTFDVVLSDDSLPQFNGRSAQAIANREAPHVPFIVVSGTVGEEAGRIAAVVDGDDLAALADQEVRRHGFGLEDAP